jgi:multisubunit Na+/H+ antiporter MnhB subunit
MKYLKWLKVALEWLLRLLTLVGVNAAAVSVAGAVSPDFDMTPVQLGIVTIVVSVMVQAYKLYRSKTGNELPKKTIKYVVYVLSFAAAVFFSGIDWLALFATFPLPGAEPTLFADALVAFLGVIVANVGAVMGVAVAVYEIALDKFYAGTGILRLPG